MSKKIAKKESKQDKTNLIFYATIVKSLKEHPAADICIICDLTGSMDPYQQAVSTVLGHFCNEAESMLSAPPRIAFIGFRDKTEGEHKMVSLDFTTDIPKVKAMIDKEMCFGGEDECEDLVAPLKKALTLSWLSDMRIVYLVIDSPAHGKTYHDKTTSDNSEEDDKEQVLEKLCQHYAKNMINLVVMKCDNKVDMMIKKMKEYYNRAHACQLLVVDMKSGWDTAKSNLNEHFKLSMSDTFAQSLTVNFGRVTRGTTKDFNSMWQPTMYDMLEFAADQYSPRFEAEPNFEDFAFRYSIVLVRSMQNVQFRLNLEQFGTGKFKDCYQLVKTANATAKFAAKISKNKITTIEEMKRDADIQTYVFTLCFVAEFNKRFPSAKMNIVPTSVLDLKDRTDDVFKGSRYIFFQPFLTGSFVKYNNNYGWVNKDSAQTNVAQAFSHFTYEASKGTLIVVDIQGIVVDDIIQLCDYAIHASHYKKQFGRVNYGTLGIRRFFATHECNDICKQLGLTHPHDIEAKELIAQLEVYPKKAALPHIFEDHSNEDQLARLSALRLFDPMVALVLNTNTNGEEDDRETRVEDWYRPDPNQLG